MRIGAISDLHGWLPEIPLRLDLLLVAGDVGAFRGGLLESFKGWSDNLTKFAAWVEEQDCPVIGVAGNHDFSFEKDTQLARTLPWCYLEDETTEKFGLTIHGAPWCNKFQDWAFMAEEDELAHKWELIPEDTDILITHGPPYGIGDELVDGRRVGSQTLHTRAGQLPDLKLHVFGHIHNAYGRWDIDGTTYANVAYLGEDYQPNGCPVQVFEL